MIGNSPSAVAISQRCGGNAGEKWQQLLRHLELSSGFSFVLLLAKDTALALFLRDMLTAELSPHCQVLSYSADTTPFIYQIPGQISAAGRTKKDAVYWIDSLPHDSDQGGLQWRKAWQYVAARLNERREALRERLQTNLILVGPPELEPLLREHAPDLWSVRAFVARFAQSSEYSGSSGPASSPWHAQEGKDSQEHKPNLKGEEPSWRLGIIPKDLSRFLFSFSEPMTPAVVDQIGGDLDPHKELIASARLRGRSDAASYLALTEQLVRVACAFGARRDGTETERVAREAWANLKLIEPGKPPSVHQQALTGLALVLIGWGLLLRKNYTEALNYAELSLEQSKHLDSCPVDSKICVQQAKLIAWSIRGYATLFLGISNSNRESIDEYLDLFEVDPQELSFKLSGLLARVPNLFLEDKIGDIEKVVRFISAPTRISALPLVERAQTHEWLADILLRKRQTEEAALELSHAALLREACGEASMMPLPIWYRATLYHELAKQLFSAERFAAAHSQAETALRYYERSTQETQAPQVELKLMLGAIELIGQKYAVGETHLRTALELCESGLVPHRTRWLAIQSSVGALLVQGKIQPAESLLREQLSKLEETGAAAATEINSGQRMLRLVGRLATLRPAPFFSIGIRLIAQTKGQMWFFRRWLRRTAAKWQQ